MRRLCIGYEHRMVHGWPKRRFTLCLRLGHRWKYVGLWWWSKYDHLVHNT
jgi:hypothetical protein